jgi:hypothetical protein
VAVSVESGPAASRERAPWPPWAVFGLQLLDGPDGVVQYARVGAEAGEAAAGDGVGQLQLASRPVSPWLGLLGATMGMEATVAMAMATATAGGTLAMDMVLTGLTVTVGDHSLWRRRGRPLRSQQKISSAVGDAGQAKSGPSHLRSEGQRLT